MHCSLTNLKRVARVLASLLISAQLLPSLALGCEGVAEVQKLSIKPIESGTGGVASGKGSCPKVLLKPTVVLFKNLTEWCEYEVKNENAVEKVILEPKPGIVPKGECEFANEEYCIGFLNKVPVGKNECKKGTVLPVGIGNQCYVRVEYEKKPSKGGKEPTSLIIKSSSIPNNGPNTLTENQEVT
jgi:hypothetical protein